MNTRPITELEIRTRLRSDLARALKAGRLVEEFPIEAGLARIDVAFIEDCLTGYEIKSDLDSFTRFANQIHAYNRVFDTIYLVTGPIHCEQALAVLPSWWGVMVARRDHQNAISLEVVRKAQCNLRQEAFSLASLLWKEEALAVLAADNQRTSKKASSHLLWQQIANSLSLDKIKQVVLEAVLSRIDYRLPAVRTT